MFSTPYGIFYNPSPSWHSSYSSPSVHSYHPAYRDLAAQRAAEQAQALAGSRARRAQYLPDEDLDSEEEYEYGYLTPRERMYLEARRKQELMERERERQRAEAAQLKEAHQKAATKLEADMAKLSQRQQQQRTVTPKSTANHFSQQPSRSTSPAPNSTATDKPPRTSTPLSQPNKPSTLEFTNVHHDAASKIQHKYRQYRSLSVISEVAARLDAVRERFSYPMSIDFINPSSYPSLTSDNVVTVNTSLCASKTEDTDAMENRVPEYDTTIEASDANQLAVPRLAFTSRNYALNAYMEELNVLLTKLDGIESYGSAKIRQRRKQVVRCIEKEAVKIEKYWRGAWRAYLREHTENA
ncbi:hypothetical protein AMATHDRAFT_7109 [Amanita thiersii Skay4041]|uniref:BAG domain-containing protein n=1 Tax=Amanita thiersii Skay4041 TaxID=703135 RepID=A0A2A9NH66_9AGAR|nr:hypothetical protein AMATHDRAFT_7109 [Amanita thiersii Skay4041]